MITLRTKISLSQFLRMFKVLYINEFFAKHDIAKISNKNEIKKIIEQADNNKIIELIREIISTNSSLNNKDYLENFNDNWGGFEQRFKDLEKCLLLDGYKIDRGELIQIEPNIEGVIAFEDELTNRLRSLSSTEEIINCIENSANHFKYNRFNDCLAQARLALETLVRKIVSEKFGEEKNWQGAISVLKSHNFLNENEGWLIKNTYGFISEACHQALKNEEYARFGRNLAMSMCYYLIKKYTQV